ncbi:MAG: cation transporter [Proteobacteria bacterium]|nr:cation transporter [Pseudomonadota bacterium]MBU6425860.1 cation transporter [Rhodospirillales bacterium]
MLKTSLRQAALAALILNFGFFFFEFAMARAIGSVSLFADSVDFLEDSAVNFLLLAVLGWGPKARAKAGMAMASFIIVPSLATLWQAIAKFWHPEAPNAAWLSLTGLAAMAVNLCAATILARHRHTGGSITRAAFLSARNDVLANAAIVLAGAVTAYLWHSLWPDLIAGLGIGAMNLDAAKEVWEAAREEHAA